MGRKLLRASAAVLATLAVSACEPQEQPQPDGHVRLARVTCGAGGTTTSTPVVEPQLDGVHILFDNEAGMRRYYIRASSDETTNHGGELSTEPKEVRTVMPPGEVLVGCFDNARDIPYEGASDGFVSISVVDPDHSWVDPRLPCKPERAGDFQSDVVDDDPNVDDLIRDLVPGVGVTDTFALPGYPEVQWHAEARQLVREGNAVAQFAVFQQRSSWHVLVWRCPGISVGD